MGLCSCGEAGKHHLIQGTEDFKKTEAGLLGGAFSSVHEGKTTHYIIVCMRQGHPDCLLEPRWFPKDSQRKAYIQACRALMIISIVLGLLATVLSLFGLKCTQVGMSNENTKVKISVTGGAIFILAGLSSVVAVSWYAARITAQFFDPLYGGTKYELGDALYLGWAGSILSMLGGIFLTCSCKGGKRGKHSDRKYDYSAGQAAHQPRIYTKNSDTVITSKDYV
ncbi:claudin-15-like isoform X3 [Mauremys reevesii]|uniref:claudin-15-like isoform X3 n=1 Tax=Mauremys reevesii TaxID=260615 RepID=UPI00193EEE67|nr:claudin-15-like isoform X3 [Mauremys reevesii]